MQNCDDRDLHLIVFVISLTLIIFFMETITKNI